MTADLYGHLFPEAPFVAVARLTLVLGVSQDPRQAAPEAHAT